MGYDAVKPFLDYEDKGVIILCRTSNKFSGDLQNLVADGRPLYEHVALLVQDKWNSAKNAALVVGATYPEELEKLRKLCPELPFLVPGVGAQGGSLEEVCKYGMNADCGLLVNASRAIIFADSSENFAAVAAEKARDYKEQMEKELSLHKII